MLNRSAVAQFFAFFLPFLIMPDAAAGVFIQRNVEFINQILPSRLQIERIVFCIVLAAFGAVV